ncbi:Recombination endonuclease VII [uncultured archaeon]|nr:Recombination endonuclease VII [uncultured archaeon]
MRKKYSEMTERQKRLQIIASQKYQASPKGRRRKQSARVRELNRISVRKYQASPKGRATRLAYSRTEKHRFYQRLWNKNFTTVEKDRAILAWKNFDGKCYCCGSTSPGHKNGWVIDHKGRKFRGILCAGCNLALGFIKDSVERCQNLISYLKETTCR